MSAPKQAHAGENSDAGAISDALREPGAYPLDPSARAGIEHIETHISHLFLSRDYVYKLRKNVRLPFLAFDRLEARNEDCASEVRLNRRLSPEIYLGVAPVETSAGVRVGAWVEPEGLDPTREHCTVMRRLDARYSAMEMLERGALERTHLDRVAERLADFHGEASLGELPLDEARGFVARTRRSIEDSLALARQWPASRIDPREVEALAAELSAHFDAKYDRLLERHRGGRLVDGHGDLHLEHVWFDPRHPIPQFIDCLEFENDLRRIDVAAEVAFLAMDLEYRDAGGLARHFLARYAARTDDFGLFEVIDLFLAHRALIRGTIAGIAGEDTGLPERRREAAWESAARHFDLARSFLVGPNEPACVLLCGTVGSGKSSVAHALAQELDGVVVSSDHTRKHLAGAAPTDRFDAEQEARIYSPEARARVYEALTRRATSITRSGRIALIDATFAKTAQRKEIRDFAEGAGIPCALVESRCDPEVARTRLTARAAEGGDASDAGPERLASSIAGFEPPTEWPTAQRWHVDTDRENWRDTIPRLAAQIRRRIRR